MNKNEAWEEESNRFKPFYERYSEIGQAQHHDSFDHGFDYGYQARDEKVCEWTYTGIDSEYKAECNARCINLYDQRYCPYCGGKIKEIL